ncbi:hypothetical protein BGZ49_009821, partial [Haplosporangium sp. Z 27]
MSKSELNKSQALRAIHPGNSSTPLPIKYIKAHYDSKSNRHFVLWDDIQLAYKNVSHLQNGDHVVTFVKDDNYENLRPLRVDADFDSVLDVYFSPHSVESALSMDKSNPRLGVTHGSPVRGSYDKSTSLRTVPDIEDTLNNTTALNPSEPLRFGLLRKSTAQIQGDMKVVTDALIARNRDGKSLDARSIIEEHIPVDYLKSADTIMSTKPGFERAVINKLDRIHEQGRTTQGIVRQVLKETQEIQDRLILIQRKTEAILTQQLELAEYPIPRLFIVLPEEPTKYDPGNWFRTKFRLHFLCECGEHTKAAGSKLPNHIHLAKHEGYLIREPTVFFKKFGPILLLMLELIKFGISIAGHVVPTLASLKVIELADSVQQTVESVTAKIDYSLECIDKQLTKVQSSSPGDFIDTEVQAPMTQQDLTNYLNDVEGLEGVELRQLGSFLKSSEEDNLLGGLYRMTTIDGHVKWVCRDHYRAGYQESHTQKLLDILRLGKGTFDEQLGRVEITLKSSTAADEFYGTIHKAKGVLELAIDLDWEFTGSDLEALANTLKKSRVSVLQLDLRRFRPRENLASKISLKSAQYKAIYRIIEPSFMKVVQIVVPKDIFKLSALNPKKTSHLYKLSFEMVIGRGFGGEARVLLETLKTKSTNSTLTSWYLYSDAIMSNGAKTLSKAFKTNSTLTTFNFNGNLIGDNEAQSLSEALKANSTLTTLNLERNTIGENGAQALFEALKTNSTLTTLNLEDNSIRYNGAQALFEALKTNSTLTTLNLRDSSIGDNRAQAL